ncbi:MAG TPA: hypothetical protein VN457_05100 [Chlamydiales bacterium]|nr:hypothetical protein [Chlamydiales bacterium]
MSAPSATSASFVAGSFVAGPAVAGSATSSGSSSAKTDSMGMYSPRDRVAPGVGIRFSQYQQPRHLPVKIFTKVTAVKHPTKPAETPSGGDEKDALDLLIKRHMAMKSADKAPRPPTPPPGSARFTSDQQLQGLASARFLANRASKRPCGIGIKENVPVVVRIGGGYSVSPKHKTPSHKSPTSGKTAAVFTYSAAKK